MGLRPMSNVSIDTKMNTFKHSLIQKRSQHNSVIFRWNMSYQGNCVNPVANVVWIYYRTTYTWTHEMLLSYVKPDMHPSEDMLSRYLIPQGSVWQTASISTYALYAACLFTANSTWPWGCLSHSYNTNMKCTLFYFYQFISPYAPISPYHIF